MRDTKVPPPALYSETLEKTRRNSLVWSGLAVAAELAQTTDHKLKSSIIGSDTTLPVAMVVLIFLLLSAFHFYAFWFEKRRIERWQSQYASEHQGIDLKARIANLYIRIEGLLLSINSDHNAKLEQMSRIEDVGFSLDNDLKKVITFYKAVNERDKELAEAMKTARHIDDNGPQGVLAKWFPAVHTNKKESVELEPFFQEIRKLRELISVEPGPDRALKEKLDTVTSELTNLADDIDISEKKFFRWYEVGSPTIALLGASAIWFAAMVWPDFPLWVRNAFLRT